MCSDIYEAITFAVCQCDKTNSASDQMHREMQMPPDSAALSLAQLQNGNATGPNDDSTMDERIGSMTLKVWIKLTITSRSQVVLYLNSRMAIRLSKQDKKQKCKQSQTCRRCKTFSQWQETHDPNVDLLYGTTSSDTSIIDAPESKTENSGRATKRALIAAVPETIAT